MPSRKMIEGYVKKTWIDLLWQNISRNRTDKDNNRRERLWELMGFFLKEEGLLEIKQGSRLGKQARVSSQQRRFHVQPLTRVKFPLLHLKSLCKTWFILRVSLQEGIF